MSGFDDRKLKAIASRPPDEDTRALPQRRRVMRNCALHLSELMKFHGEKEPEKTLRNLNANAIIR